MSTNMTYAKLFKQEEDKRRIENKKSKNKRKKQ